MDKILGRKSNYGRGQYTLKPVISDQERADRVFKAFLKEFIINYYSLNLYKDQIELEDFYNRYIEFCRERDYFYEKYRGFRKSIIINEYGQIKRARNSQEDKTLKNVVDFSNRMKLVEIFKNKFNENPFEDYKECYYCKTQKGSIFIEDLELNICEECLEQKRLNKCMKKLDLSRSYNSDEDGPSRNNPAYNTSEESY